MYRFEVIELFTSTRTRTGVAERWGMEDNGDEKFKTIVKFSFSFSLSFFRRYDRGEKLLTSATILRRIVQQRGKRNRK